MGVVIVVSFPGLRAADRVLFANNTRDWLRGPREGKRIPTDRPSDLQLPESPNIDSPGSVLRPFRIGLIIRFFLDRFLPTFLTLELATRDHNLPRTRALPSSDVCSRLGQPECLALSSR